MRWSELEQRQPRLAEVGRRRLLDPGVVLVATIRRDGTPRLSPVEPFVLEGELWLSMMPTSTKAHDLDRDPRILVHNVIADSDDNSGEFKIRGSVRDEPAPDVQQRYADAVADALGWRPAPGRFRLFAVRIDDITVVRYDAATGDQSVTRWPTGGEYIRRATTPTTLGPPEPRHELLAG
jgi:hypothetical protein